MAGGLKSPSNLWQEPCNPPSFAIHPHNSRVWEVLRVRDGVLLTQIDSLFSDIPGTC